MIKNNSTTNSPDAFNIPSILIGLPNGSDVEVSFITHRCISVFEHRDGSATQVRGEMGLAMFLSQLIAPEPEPPVAVALRLPLRESVRIPAVSNPTKEQKMNIPTKAIGRLWDYNHDLGIKVEDFRKQFGVYPTLIKMHSLHNPYGLKNYRGARMEANDKLPLNKVMLHYDPAESKVA